MEEKFVQESEIIELNDIEREREIIRNIRKAKEDLIKANVNFEFAEYDLVDYYIYQIKAIQAKLDYLIRLAKNRNIQINKLGEIEVKYEIQENKVG
ncbi:hypothetical protein D3C72_1591530 [compost metagenome]